MDERYVVAEGIYGDGLAWVMWARWHEPREGDLLSMVRISDAAGQILHASAVSGAPLHPGHLLNLTTGGSEAGPRVLLGRVHTKVQRLVLTAHDGTTLDVPLYDCPNIPGARFALLLMPRDLPLESVAAQNGKGAELERLDLRLQQGRWEARHWRPAPT